MTAPPDWRQLITFIGVDPGPVPGFVVLNRRGHTFDVEAVQCTASTALCMLETLLNDFRPSLGSAPACVQIEDFVVRRAASKSGRAGAVTRALVGRLEREAGGHQDVKVVTRSAAQVKPWATDERLKAVKTGGTDLLDVVSHVGRHARDAARHALFCAVHDGGIPDPLSTRNGASA